MVHISRTLYGKITELRHTGLRYDRVVQSTIESLDWNGLEKGALEWFAIVWDNNC